jgi:hypothetical protein
MVSFGVPDPAGCELSLAEIVVGVEAAFCACVPLVEAELKLRCDGFEHLVIEVDDIAMPGFPGMLIDAEIAFTVQTKSLTLSPSMDFGPVACFDLYFGAADAGSVALYPIKLDGIGLRCEIGDVEIAALSYWGDGKPGLLAGTEYWEVYSISVDNEACCGPLSFEAAVYFLEDGAGLFDVALLDAELAIEITGELAFSVGLALDLEPTSSVEWTLGIEVEW